MGKMNRLKNGKNDQKISSQFPDSHLILVLLIFVSQIDPILLSMPPTDYLLCILEKIREISPKIPYGIIWTMIFSLKKWLNSTDFHTNFDISITFSSDHTEILAKISAFESFLSEHIIFDQIFRYLIL